MSDFTTFLWLLKLGAVVNLYFLAKTLGLPEGADAHLVIPAQIFFAVSAYRCLFPNRYEGNVVFHSGVLSSTFVTRVLATFSEVAYVYLFSHVIRLLNVERVGWVDALSWLMVVQTVVSQCCVWGAILSRRLMLYFYEEVGWFAIFAANTLASAYLYWTVPSFEGREILIYLNLVFGVGYLPWQVIHLRVLRSNAKRDLAAQPSPPITAELLVANLTQSIRETNRTTAASDWGNFVGLTWMTAYWVAVIPVWIHVIVTIIER